MDMVTELRKEITENSENLKKMHVPQPSPISIPDARVTSTIPTDLVGTFLHVKPRKHLPADGHHMFEGDGALTRVRMHGYEHATFA